MLLERTLFQLDRGYVPPAEAEALGQLGYLQWLGALQGSASYPSEARRALTRAAPFARTSPAVAVFRRLLLASLTEVPRPLPLALPARSRRGGARARRLSL